MSEVGKPLFPNMKYCTRCCLPESCEGIRFDEMGVCQACQSAEQKIHIDWTKREYALRELLEKYRRPDRDYDCIVPISGGKDSTFQLHVITQIYGLKPLAVTFSHNWYTETGKYNLENALEKFNVDHIMFAPNRALVNKLARKSLYLLGDSCWHCHSGVGAFPLQIAVKYQIPLLIWGESIAEASGRASHLEPLFKFDHEYFIRVSAKFHAEELVSEADGLTMRDLAPFRFPSAEEIEKVGIVGIHLGDYLFWDDERQMEFVRDVYGWREDQVEGTYKRYKSVECRMAGVHDYTKFLKRGYGRGTDHATADVRAGLLTRQDAFELAKRHDTERPPGLDYYLQVTGFSEQEFDAVMRKHREKQGIKALSEAEFSRIVAEHRRKYAARDERE